MKKSKLNIRFHNPNSAEDTAEYITKIFIEVNKSKLERVLTEIQNESEANSEIVERTI